MQIFNLVHRKRVDLPAFWFFAADPDRSCDAFSLASNDLSEINPTGILDQNIQRSAALCGRQRQARSIQPSIERLPTSF